MAMLLLLLLVCGDAACSDGDESHRRIHSWAYNAAVPQPAPQAPPDLDVPPWRVRVQQAGTTNIRLYWYGNKLTNNSSNSSTSRLYCTLYSDN